MGTTVVGLYDDRDHAEHAVQDLIDAGIPRGQISAVASDAEGKTQRYNVDQSGTLAAGGAVSGATSGAVVGGVIGLLVGVGTLAFPAVGLVAAGPIAGLFTGAGIGAVSGGVIGALVGLGIPEDEAHAYAESIRRGGTLVTVHADEDRSEQVFQILDRDGAVDINRRVEDLKAAGFTTYDPDAPAYPRESTEENRERYSANREALDTPTGNRVRSYTGGTAAGLSANLAAAGSTAEATSGIGSTPLGTATSLDASTQGFPEYEQDFRSDFASQDHIGESYESYEPAYRYGYELGNHPNYTGRPWPDVEREVRSDWEKTNPDTWDRFKASIRHAWSRATGEGPRALSKESHYGYADKAPREQLSPEVVEDVNSSLL